MGYAVLATLLCCAAVGTLAGPQVSSGPDFNAPLRFTAAGTFQISIFEDLHFGENYWDSWGPQQDVNSVRVLNEVLDRENPQLVVLNGDLITGENAFRDNSTAVIHQIAAPLVQRNLSWASTYGNHDSQFNLSRAQILATEHEYPNARTTNMFPDNTFGVTNYYLPVYGAADDPTTAPPKLLLWFFDSRGGFLYNTTNATTGQQVGQPDWVAAEVAAWFTTTHAALTAQHNGTAIPSLAFVHIPVNASRALQSVGVDPQRQPGINDDVPLAAQAQGWCADGRNDGSCAYGGQDVPFMRALTSTPRLLALFSGHDHGDTWCYKWNAESLPGAEVKGNGISESSFTVSLVLLFVVFVLL